MPELPEVEHLRRTIEPTVLGATIVEFRLHRDDIAVRGMVAEAGPVRSRRLAPDLPARLRGRGVTAVDRHGKLLLVRLDDGAVLLIHLGMSGQVLVADTVTALPRRDHVHAVARLRDSDGIGAVLAFRDPRRFGGLGLIAPGVPLPAPWSGCGPDAWTGRPIGVDSGSSSQGRTWSLADHLRERCRRQRRAIKAALLDQRVIAGIGNIYADELLHRAGIHPLRPCSLLTTRQWRRIAAATHAVLADAIRAGGSTIRTYADAANRPGTFSARHAVYGRADEPCLRCGRPLVASTVAGRTTTHCPSCQPVPRRRRPRQPLDGGSGCPSPPN